MCVCVCPLDTPLAPPCVTYKTAVFQQALQAMGDLFCVTAVQSNVLAFAILCEAVVQEPALIGSLDGTGLAVWGAERRLDSHCAEDELWERRSNSD